MGDWIKKPGGTEGLGEKCPKCGSNLLFLSMCEELRRGTRVLSQHLEARCPNKKCKWLGYWDTRRGELVDFMFRLS